MIRQICLLLIVGALVLSACGSSSPQPAQSQTDRAMLQATIDALQATVDASSSTDTSLNERPTETPAVVVPQSTPSPAGPADPPTSTADVSSPLVQPSTIREKILGCWRFKESESTDGGLWFHDIMCFFPDGSYLLSHHLGGRYDLSANGVLLFHQNPSHDDYQLAAQVEMRDSDKLTFSSDEADFVDLGALFYARIEEDELFRDYLVGRWVWENSNVNELVELTNDGRILGDDYDDTYTGWQVFTGNVFVVWSIPGSPAVLDNGGSLIPFGVRVKSDDEFELLSMVWDPVKKRIIEGDEVSFTATRFD